jgi:ribulose-phosphate 3-epimerase
MIEDSGYDCDIEVDGGIHDATIAQAVNAGANLLVAGSAVYSAEGGVAASITRLRSAIEQG